jgi:hypothetical protein
MFSANVCAWNVAALREGRRIEVHDDGALLQGVRERVVELLTGQRRLGAEHRRRVALLQSGNDGQCDGDRCQASEQQLFHGSPKVIVDDGR